MRTLAGCLTGTCLPCRPPPGVGLRVLQGEVHDGHHQLYLAHQHTAFMIPDLTGFITVKSKKAIWDRELRLFRLLFSQNRRNYASVAVEACRSTSLDKILIYLTQNIISIHRGTEVTLTHNGIYMDAHNLYQYQR